MAVSASASKGVVFISLENWDEIWRRNQFLVARFAKRGLEPIVYVVPQRDLTNALRRLEWHRFKRREVFHPDGLDSVNVVQPTKFLPNSIGWARMVYERTYRSLIKRSVLTYGMTRPLLWINDHSAAHIVGAFEHGPVVYDITDDWTESSQSPKMLEQIRRQDEYLCGVADAVIVCSQHLYDVKTRLVNNLEKLHLIPNGVDNEHYARSQEPFDECLQWEQPVFMYTGTVHADRLDVDFVVDMAGKLDKGTLAFVGPTHLSAADQSRLAACPRVRCVGPVPYKDIPRWMASAVGFVVPHKITRFTESLNPLKLWEYLASGKPTISTPVAGFRDLPQLVYLAETPDKFLELMRSVANESPTLVQGRQAFARFHSWENRVDEIQKILADIIKTNSALAESVVRT